MDYNIKNSVLIQNTVHICTKLKTRFTKPNILLPMGIFHISPDHIKKVMENFSKDQHMLCHSYLNSRYFCLRIISLHNILYFNR